MKKRPAPALMLALSFFAMDAFGEIRESHHDFAWAGLTTGRLCVVCHTPHNADTTVPNSPLWNHQVTAASYTVYASDTLNAVPGQPTGVSKLCLSCHDGTVAIDAYDNNPGGSWYAGFGNFTTNLTPHHPISFVYDTNLSNDDGELWDPSSKDSGLGGTIQQDLLRNDRLECISCHDVHASRNTQGCTGCHFVGPYTTLTLSLWKDNTESQLCLTCHDK